MIDDTPRYLISAAAKLAGMHPQTLRQYDRLGIVVPRRARGAGRRYSARDVYRLQEVQRLSQEEGINLAGIKRILDLENQIDILKLENEYLRALASPGSRVFTADAQGDVVSVRSDRMPKARRRHRRSVQVYQITSAPSPRRRLLPPA